MRVHLGPDRSADDNKHVTKENADSGMWVEELTKVARAGRKSRALATTQRNINFHERPSSCSREHMHNRNLGGGQLNLLYQQQQEDDLL